MKIHIKIASSLHQSTLEDLMRPHGHAYERVGFLFASHKIIDGDMYIWLNEYMPVNDKHYIRDATVGARIDSNAIRMAMQLVLDDNRSCFHVHLHGHKGVPYPSKDDQTGIPGMVKSMVNVRRDKPHGYIIFSEDSFYAAIWNDVEQCYQTAQCVSVIGTPMKLQYLAQESGLLDEQFIRQSFLGNNAQFLFEQVRVGIVGLGGGGSHIAQQMAHIGIKQPIIFDADHVEESNLNRLVGAWFADVLRKTFKTQVAKRMMKKIFPKVNIKAFNSRWQDVPEQLQTCDVVIGCVDDYASRAELEAECRRFLIPYVDIGMDIYQGGDKSYFMAGQVITSIPGCHCMRCMQFITEEKLGVEAAKYGNVGGRPQVVWPNGVLASTAIGILVNLITGWSKHQQASYLSYDGNLGTVTPHKRLHYLPENGCVHFPIEDCGIPKLFSL
jgi:molybdopterin/thiamine biosynthesis adenylyltransferase